MRPLFRAEARIRHPSGIELADARQYRAKVVAASKVVFECKLSDMLEVGDHHIFLPQMSLPYMAMTAKSSCLHTTTTDVQAPLSKADKSSARFGALRARIFTKDLLTPYKRF